MVNAEFWVPLQMTPALMPELMREAAWTDRDGDWLYIDARLKPGVTREQALAAVKTVQGHLDEQYRKDADAAYERYQQARAVILTKGQSNG